MKFAFARCWVLVLTTATLASVLLGVGAFRTRPWRARVMPAPLPDQILFTGIYPAGDGKSTSELSWDLWVMNPDGSDRRRLTHDGMLEVDPAWAPGGTQIAFAAFADPRYRHVDLWVIAADGSRRRQVTHEPEGMMAVSPVWSPDARQLAFGRVAWDGLPPSPEVWITDMDGGRIRHVGPGFPVGWPPAGDLLITRPEQGLWTIPAAGGEAKPLIPAADDVACSPDGTRLAFMAERDQIAAREVFHPSLLWVAGGTGNRPDVVTRFENDAIFGLRWTADRQHLLYSCPVKELKQFWKFEFVAEEGIYTIDARGGRPRRLSPGHGIEEIGGGQDGFNLLEQTASLLRPQGPREDDFFEALVHHDPARAIRDVEEGMDPNARDTYDVPAVVESAEGGREGVLRDLIARGANVNARGPGYNFDSALAKANDIPTLTRLLLDAGARPNPPVFEEAGRTGNAEVLALLRALRRAAPSGRSRRRRLLAAFARSPDPPRPAPGPECAARMGSRRSSVRRHPWTHWEESACCLTMGRTSTPPPSTAAPR